MKRTALVKTSLALQWKSQSFVFLSKIHCLRLVKRYALGCGNLLFIKLYGTSLESWLESQQNVCVCRKNSPYNLQNWRYVAEQYCCSVGAFSLEPLKYLICSLKTISTSSPETKAQGSSSGLSALLLNLVQLFLRISFDQLVNSSF